MVSFIGWKALRSQEFPEGPWQSQVMLGSPIGSQEVLLAFMIQAYFFKDPVGIWNILGGLLVLISGLCISSEPFFLKIYKTFRSNMMQSTGHITNSENFPKLENVSGKEEDINEYARTSV